MPNMGIKAAVLDFLVARAGVPTSTNVVADSLDITKAQAVQALAAFVNDGNAGVVRVSNGIYAYTGPPVSPRATPARHLNNSAAESFTVIGTNKAGETLVRDASGTVYRLVEV